jgi:hypothetical protein
MTVLTEGGALVLALMLARFFGRPLNLPGSLKNGVSSQNLAVVLIGAILPLIVFIALLSEKTGRVPFVRSLRNVALDRKSVV